MKSLKSLAEIYVALDFEDKQQALSFLQNNNLAGIPVKTGMELFYREGPRIIHDLKEKGHPVFLDLKLHDIPQTVKRAMKNLASLGVDVVNVHASGGKEMIQAAREGLREGSINENSRPVLLAVTQLTSTDQNMLTNELLIPHSVKENVAHLAELSRAGGADGVVCSVEETKIVKQVCGSEFLTLTPGIRQQNETNHDQKRVASPHKAGGEGTDAIVVGRSITQAQSPETTYKQIREEFLNGQQ
ncbi:orotidine-5'-phosphate decarboxylase [Halobacillus sp. A5]|nr:orotidine-5'-phosphate decarboxylase [Halobacillus sp. A5]